MIAYVHIIVTQADDHWSAAYRETLQVGFGGEIPSVAILRLLEFTGANVDVEGIVAIEEATRDGHLEFLIPCRESHRIPIPSMN